MSLLNWVMLIYVSLLKVRFNFRGKKKEQILIDRDQFKNH